MHERGGSDATPSPGAPGWYADPETRFEQRFFDGERWTRRVRVGRCEAIDAGGSAVTDDEGWYADPLDRFERRYFDGRSWSKQIRSGQALATDIKGVPARTRLPPGAARPSRPEARPPGWYADPQEGSSGLFWIPDPEVSARERWWDGYEWTAKVRPAGQRHRERDPAGGLLRRARVTAVIVGVLLVLFVAGLLLSDVL